MGEHNLPEEIISLLEEACGNKIDNFEISVHGEDVGKNGSMAEWILISLRNRSTKEVLDLIVKQTVTANLTATKALMDATYFNEIYFYKTLWAEMDKFQRSYPGLQSFDKVPKYYASRSVPGKEKLVLENLIASGFQMFPRSGIFDDMHVDYLLKSYGQFHGISAAFREIYPERFKDLENKVRQNAFECLMNVDIMNHLLTQVMRKLSETVKDEKIKEKLKGYCEKPLKMILESFNYVSKNPVINHGDPWSNNMMFKYEKDGKLLDFRMLDFQLIRTGSVVIDLSYLLYGGAIMGNKFDNYLKTYHDSFSNTLRHFNLDPLNIFTFDDLKEEWKYCNTYGLVMSQLLWRGKFSEPNEKMTVVGLAEGGYNKKTDDTVDNVANREDHPKVKEICLDLVKHLCENNFL